MRKRMLTVLAAVLAATGLAGPAFAAPVAKLTLYTDEPYSPFVYADATTSTGTSPIVSYAFDFGDGTPVQSGSQGNVLHQYQHGGVYLIKVTVTSADGTTATAQHETPPIVTFVRRTALLSRSNLAFVSADGAATKPIVANRTVADAWEQFFVQDVGNGEVIIAATLNFRYLIPETPGATTLVPNGTSIAAAARFRLVNGPDGLFSLQLSSTGKYVSSNNGIAPMTADRTEIGQWEQFWATLETGVTIGAFANGRTVTAESAGQKPLIANRTAGGAWETFAVIDAGNGQAAFLAQANTRFVTAEAGGTQPLIANRTTVGAWEKFTIIQGDGYQALQAGANGRYVTAEDGGNKPLIANRTAVGAWEHFWGLNI